LGRPRKTLLERVLENSFRPGRYGPLLAAEELPARSPFTDRRRRLIWDRLLEMQEHYRTAQGDELRDADWYRAVYAAAFSSYVRGLHGRLLSYLQPEPQPASRPKQPPPGPAEYVFSVRLRCEECSWESEEEAVGWVALLGYDPREDDYPAAVVFCPECAVREFEFAPRRTAKEDVP